MRYVTATWLGPEPGRLLWPDPETGPFLIRMHWAQVDGVGRLVGVDLRSVETDDRGCPPQPVNTLPPAFDRHGNEHPRDEQRPVLEPFAKITVEHWRAVGFNAIRQRRAELLKEAELLRQWEVEYPKGKEPDTLGLDGDLRALKRGRERGLPASHYEDVARVVLEAHAAGQTQTLKVIQAHFGGPGKVSRDTANYWRKRAQELGYLQPPVPRGRKGPKSGARSTEERTT